MMKPYKKRLIEQLEDDRTEYNSLSPKSPCSSEDKKEEKLKKVRKKKVSRKQFRHDNIQVFIPGSDPSPCMLKQKETYQIVQKSESSIKEAITESIVTSLAGQKTDNNSKKRTFNTGSEESTVGRHHLPAIVLETPTVRRRSHDNINLTRTDIKTQEETADQINNTLKRRSSINMPSLTDIEERKLEPIPKLILKRRKTIAYNESESNSRELESGIFIHNDTNVNTVSHQNDPDYPLDMTTKKQNQETLSAIGTINNTHAVPVRHFTTTSHNGGRFVDSYSVQKHTPPAEVIVYQNAKISAPNDIIQEQFESPATSPLSKTIQSVRPKLKQIYPDDETVKMYVKLLITDMRKVFSQETLARMSVIYQELQKLLSVDRLSPRVSGQGRKTLNEVYDYISQSIVERNLPSSLISFMLSPHNAPRGRQVSSMDYTVPNQIPIIPERVYENHLNNVLPTQLQLLNRIPMDYDRSVLANSLNQEPTRLPQMPPNFNLSRNVPRTKLNNEPSTVINISSVVLSQPPNCSEPENPSVGNIPLQATNNKYQNGSIKVPEIAQMNPNWRFRGPPNYSDAVRQMTKNRQVIMEPQNIRIPNDLQIIPNQSKVDHNIFNSVPYSLDSHRNLMTANLFNQDISGIRPAVIVADKSMQITKETTNPNDIPINPENQTGVIKHDELLLEETATSATIDQRIKLVSVNDTDKRNVKNIVEEKKIVVAEKEENTDREFRDLLKKIKSKISNYQQKLLVFTELGLTKAEHAPVIKNEEPIEIEDDSDEDVSNDVNIGEEGETTQPKQQTFKGNAKTQKRTKQDESIHDVNKNCIHIKPNLGDFEISASNKIEELVMIENNNNYISNKKLRVIPPPLPSITDHDRPPKLIPLRLTALRPNDKIYSPEIEPISPPANGRYFIYPEPRRGLAIINSPPCKSPSGGNSSSSESKTPRNSFAGAMLLSPGDTRSTVTSLSFPPTTSNIYYNPNRRISTDTTSNVSDQSHNEDDKLLVRSTTTPTIEHRVAPNGKLCYDRNRNTFTRYFDNTQVELFIKNLNVYEVGKYNCEMVNGRTDLIKIPTDVIFSDQEELPEVEDYVKEADLVQTHVPKDFANFYKYVTGYQILRKKNPISFLTFLTMYNTNRLSQLLSRYLRNVKDP